MIVMRSLAELAPHARSLAEESLRWTEQFWDPEMALLALDSEGLAGPVHSVRNSAWYALGLLLRNQGDDVERAVRTFHAVLDYQFDEPGAPYHGTFYRAPQEAHPPADAVIWRDYDPNWRQFIGTTLAIALEEYSERLPGGLIRRMDRAIELAVVGEPPDRCAPHYTNIALMKSALMTWAGDRYGRPKWLQEGEAFGQAAYDVFRQHGAFHEYNSPTYYGVNFYALAFWRLYSHSQKLIDLGAEMEAALWRDTARYYHAGLGNVAGPYSRTYGMDMRKYGALLGMSIWLAVGRKHAPFPRASGIFEHGADFCYGPPMAVVGTLIPDDVLPHLLSFQGERQVEQRLPTNHDRVASAWVGEQVLIGAESLRLTGDLPGIVPNLDSDQYHPVTIHWRTPDGDVGWLRLRHKGPVEARAEQGRLSVIGPYLDAGAARYGAAHRIYRFEIYSPGGVTRIHNISSRSEAGESQIAQWTFAGVSLQVRSNLKNAQVERQDDLIQVIYRLPEDEQEARFEITIA
jgi:hypothetical protein